VFQCRKYAKWKAAYIHNCLKSGETPIAGPLATGEEEDDQGMDQEHGMDQELGTGVEQELGMD